jgi:hypothetical protein
MIVCSAIGGKCLEPIQRLDRFNTWADCMRAGYKDSIEIMQQLGDATVNNYQTYVKFVCSNRFIPQLPKIKPNGTNGELGQPT